MQYILQQLLYPRTSSSARIVTFDETLVGLRKKGLVESSEAERDN